jgi:hypothetical protein
VVNPITGQPVSFKLIPQTSEFLRCSAPNTCLPCLCSFTQSSALVSHLVARFKLIQLCHCSR